MATVITPNRLRGQLRFLARRRGDLIHRQQVLEQDIGEVLVDVTETEGITLTEAAQLLGVSKPTAYRLLKSLSKSKE